MSDSKEALLETIGRFDETFAADKGSDLADFWSESGRLMFPFTEDIAGRVAIRDVLQLLMERYTTLNWQPDRRLLDIHEREAYGVGRFVELRKNRHTGEMQKIFGRLVEVWRLEAAGQWRLRVLISARYAEPEITP